MLRYGKKTPNATYELAETMIKAIVFLNSFECDKVEFTVHN